MNLFVLVSYDIINDKRRRKVMDTMEGYGRRVQYSVFECWLRPEQIITLKNRLKQLVKKEDSVRFYFVPKDEIKKIVVLGHGKVSEETSFIVN